MENKVQPPKKSKKRLGFIMIGIIILIGLFFGIKYLVYALKHVSTDNAELQTDVYQLIPQVSGRIAKSYVDDFQHVKKGDTLFIIETDDYAIRVASAKANLQNAIADLEVAKRSPSTLRTGLGVPSSNIKAMEAANIKAQQDLERGKNLVKDDVITRANYDALKAAADAAEAQYQSAKSQYAFSQKQIGTAEDQIKAAEAVVAMRQADLANARLLYSYTTIIAPADGQLSETKIQKGQFVQAGQPLTTMLGSSIWIVANYKETQLRKIHKGDEAVITVDAYPQKKFKGKVTSLSPATGATFSLLPPDNSTGNFVKVVQLVPVKIEFNGSIPTNYNLEAGMSVNVSIATKQ
ncbi:HlyD family secretion protein [Kaistella sp.]|uniref:HlyD family secretion protein n=1 Tax=Kaistella sp. TaxID=2782235 RepID=UPI003C6B2ADA